MLIESWMTGVKLCKRGVMIGTLVYEMNEMHSNTQLGEYMVTLSNFYLLV